MLCYAALTRCILIAVNKNEQSVKAVAANYQQPVSKLTKKRIQPRGEVRTNAAGAVEV